MGVSPRDPRPFGVYQNPAIASALSALSMRPTRRDVTVIVTVSVLSAFLLLGLIYRREGAVAALAVVGIPQDIASILVQAAQVVATILVILAVTALWKAVCRQAAADASVIVAIPPKSDSTQPGRPWPAQTATSFLTKHQQTLLGMPVAGHKKLVPEKGEAESSADIAGMINNLRQRPPRVRASPTQPSKTASPALLVPVHPHLGKGGRGQGGGGTVSPWGGRGSPVAVAGPVSSMSPTGAVATPGTPYGVQVSSYSAPSYVSSSSGVQVSPHELISTPWSTQRGLTLKDDIQSEEKLAKFLAEVDTKMTESAGKTALVAQGFMTPSPTLRGVGGNATNASPIPTPVSLSSTPRSGPIRTLRMSPSSQKGGVSPKKGEGELPGPMSMDQVTDGFRRMGVLSYMDEWRDRLRQWFSEVLLNPLAHKIDISHLQVMAAAAKLSLSINVAQVGGSRQETGGGPIPASAEGPTYEWLTTVTADEDALLHQLRAALMQARDTPPTPQPSLFGLQSLNQGRIINPSIQECLDAVTEHQRLRVLMKGEWVKGLLPLSSVRADYAVQRIRELAEGTCMKKFDFMGSGGDGLDKSKPYNPELPSDPHLLLYLFCALLEHPQWMLHVDPTTHPSMQSGNNPLFVASMPHKERFPEKYIAVLSTAPGALHVGACILAISKQTPPVFALYWEKKLQFSFQGRTALWDAILLLCYRIKVAHGGVVRGFNLGSPAFNLLSLLEPPFPSSPVRCVQIAATIGMYSRVDFRIAIVQSDIQR